ncbi:UNVERIFIED_ORG: hypothetical protein J2W65_003518 [Pseudomonas parafulva]|nr:hypothetical protein [Pseudomonas parafulva]
MASTKKQEKPSVVLEQAVPAPGDQALNSPPGGSDSSGAEPVANTVHEAGGPEAEQPVELAPADTSAEGAADTGVSPNQPGQAGDALHVAADMAGLEELTSSAPAEVNTAQVEVYPLRSFMDEGELRRRGGPSYQVPRLHAEDLERRNLVSRTPLEE